MGCVSSSDKGFISKILESTSTTTVPEKRGMQWLNPFSTLTNYGTMKVKGEDNTPPTPKDP